jgi:glyoxylase-like metal-dependent hydrolase (beta-lactamase superfamily II)
VFLAEAQRIQVLLTHGHGDHAALAPELASRVGARILAPPSYQPDLADSGVVASLGEGDVITTDQGQISVLGVPGHTRDHLAFHWLAADALFVGDLLLGRGNTTWIGEYPDSVADYLGSLEKVRALAPGTIYPTHGPPIRDPVSRLDRFEDHRRDRIDEVREARRIHPSATAEELAQLIYGGELPAKVAGAARKSAEAHLYYLSSHQQKGRRKGS